jgi:uncharacterized protein (DUF58 family)
MPSGMLFLLALSLTGAGAFLSGNNLIFLVFAAMMALLLVSGFISRLVLSGLQLELLLPEHVSARMPAAARVRIRNIKWLTPSFSIELAGQTSNPVYFPMIPGRSTVQVPITVVFPYRGRHQENLFSVSTKFPFGFLRKTARVTLRRETIVYPAIEPREATELLLDSIAGEIETHLRGDGHDFYRVRPYEPQDNARHVDWKSTAHAGALQVREFTRDQHASMQIFFDRQIEPGQEERFEEVVENCAYVVWGLADREARVWFRADGFGLALPEEGDVWDVLRFLALVEPVVRPEARAEARPGTAADQAIQDPHVQLVFSTRRPRDIAADVVRK